MKNSLTRLIFTFGLLSLMPLALTACASDDEPEDSQPAVSEVQPPVAPPAIEDIPIIDDPTHEIWRNGYWVLAGANFKWVPGKVISRPSPTAVWVTATWQQHNYGWSFQQGHWQ